MTTQVVWFKRDLRAHDHAPLAAAAARGPVLALYVIEPDLWQQPDSSSRHWQFIRESLIDLSQSLRHLGGALVVQSGSLTQVLQRLREDYGSFELHSHEETGNAWTYARDLQVAAWCAGNGIVWHEYPSNGVIRRLGNRDRWAALRNATMAKPQLERPVAISFAPVPPTLSAESIPDIADPRFGASTPRVQRGGRTEGLKVLASFLDDRSERYMTTISKPGVDLTRYFWSMFNVHKRDRRRGRWRSRDTRPRRSSISFGRRMSWAGREGRCHRWLRLLDGLRTPSLSFKRQTQNADTSKSFVKTKFSYFSRFL